MKKQIITKKTVYPLFEELSTQAIGTKWEDLFKNCAKGNLPKGVNLNGRVISYSRLNEIEHYELSQNSKEAFAELCQFFTSHSAVGQYIKNTENKNPTKKIVKTVKNEKIGHSVWKSIKSKHIKTALLSRFVESIEKEYELDTFQRNQFLYILYIAEISGILDTSIEMENGLIRLIRCIEYDGTTFYYKKDKMKSKKTILYVSGPGNPIYNRYTDKQIDPDDLYAKHTIALNRKSRGLVVKKASKLRSDFENSLKDIASEEVGELSTLAAA